FPGNLAPSPIPQKAQHKPSKTTSRKQAKPNTMVWPFTYSSATGTSPQTSSNINPSTGDESSTVLLPTTGAPDDNPPPYTATPNANPLRRPPPLNLPVLNALRSKRCVLASTSPRRRQLISMLSLPNLQVVAPTFAENLPKSLTPFEYVAQTAEQKCVGVYAAQVDRDEKEAG